MKWFWYQLLIRLLDFWDNLLPVHVLADPCGAGGKQKLEIYSVVKDDWKTELNSFIKCWIRSFIRSKINTPIGERCQSTHTVAKPQSEACKKINRNQAWISIHSTNDQFYYPIWTQINPNWTPVETHAVMNKLLKKIL